MARKALTTRIDPELWKAFRIHADHHEMSYESLANVGSVITRYFFEHCEGQRSVEEMFHEIHLKLSPECLEDVRQYDALTLEEA